MMGIESVKRGILRSLGVVATAVMVMSAAPSADAVSLIGPGVASAAHEAPDALTTQVRGGHGGGGHGGGFHGGGFHGGGGGFHGGGGFRGGGFHGGGFHRGGFYRGGGYGYRPRFYGYAPSYSYGPRRFCRIVLTYYGPRRVCRFRPWFHPHRRHHYWRYY